MAKPARRKPKRSVEAEVMLASRRRCCLCVFLDDIEGRRKGQIAHLNQDRTNSRFENLVFLCFEHHDEYDSKTSQSKSLLVDEVREYRERLYARYREAKSIALESSTESDLLIQAADNLTSSAVHAKSPAEDAFLSRPWRFPLWQVANQPEFFAYKARNGADGVCLIERINLPDGRIVIACMQATGNPGRSITNSVEELCQQVCQRFDIVPERLVWLEHYDYYEPDEWNMVTFSGDPKSGRFENPQWMVMTDEMWRDLRLRPKKKLRRVVEQFDSKLKKLFHWPTEGLL